jgi:hypothetical protein
MIEEQRIRPPDSRDAEAPEDEPLDPIVEERETEDEEAERSREGSPRPK